MSVQSQTLPLPTPRGTAVSAWAYTPEPEVPVRASVVIGGAMGVAQLFYRPFAQWLAAQGYVVYSFDFCGQGESRTAAERQSLRACTADLFHWAGDFDTVVGHALQARPELPLYLVGHSLGAQLPGMLAHRDRVAGLVSVAAGSGYWRDNAPPLKRVVLYFWYGLVPLSTALWGYFPGNRLRKVGDLPRGVILQWRRWCLNPRYHVGAEGDVVREQFASVRFPLVALSITDDEMMTERGTQVLLDCYANAPRRLVRVTPADAGAAKIGHFGLFREKFQSSLWVRVASLLQGFQLPEETA